MKKTILILAFLATLITNAQGLNFSSKEQISKYNKYDFESKGYATNIPSNFSLEKYVPPILKQEGGTCVGYSTLYYALSTMYNIKFDITSSTEKYACSFDPYYTYSFLNKSTKCEEGLVFEDSFDLQMKIGAKKMYFPLFSTCDSSFDEQQSKKAINYSIPYKIKEVYYLESEEVNYIKNIKEIIYDNHPLMFGIDLTKSFERFNSKKNINGMKKDGLWKPKPNEKETGGHAMCIVGYDDVKFGGCFKVVNSWGADFGANGYVYIKYNDFKRRVNTVYAYEIDDSPINFVNYKRMLLTENKIYEGEVNNQEIPNGYGIFSKEHKYFLIGKFINGVKNGVFVSINKEEDYISYIEYENDEIVNKLGFADKTEDKTITDLKKYMKKVMPNVKVVNSDEVPDIDISIKK